MNDAPERTDLDAMAEDPTAVFEPHAFLDMAAQERLQTLAQDLADHFGESLEDAVARIKGQITEDSSKRPLPRHRPPTFKDPTKTVAPRLPKNIFGAPRATR